MTGEVRLELLQRYVLHAERFDELAQRRRRRDGVAAAARAAAGSEPLARSVRLSPREGQALVLVAEGLNNHEIAERLHAVAIAAGSPAPEVFRTCS